MSNSQTKNNTGNQRKERRCCGCGYTRPCSTYKLRRGGYTWFCDECNPDLNPTRRLQAS